MAVVTFGETANTIKIPDRSQDEPCFENNLAHASYANKERIRSVLERLHRDQCISHDTRTCSLSLTSRYSVGFRKAMEIHEDNTINRELSIFNHAVQIQYIPYKYT